MVWYRGTTVLDKMHCACNTILSVFVIHCIKSCDVIHHGTNPSSLSSLPCHQIHPPMSGAVHTFVVQVHIKTRTYTNSDWHIHLYLMYISLNSHHVIGGYFNYPNPYHPGIGNFESFTTTGLAAWFKIKDNSIIFLKKGRSADRTACMCNCESSMQSWQSFTLVCTPVVCCHICFQDTIYNHIHLYSSHNLWLIKNVMIYSMSCLFF